MTIEQPADVGKQIDESIRKQKQAALEYLREEIGEEELTKRVAAELNSKKTT